MCLLKRWSARTQPKRKHRCRHGVEIVLLGIVAEVLAVTPAFSATPETPAVVEAINPLTGSLLNYTTQAPLQRVRMAFLHQGPELPPAKRWTLGINAIWSNTWIDSDRAVIDNEAVWLNPVVEYGVTDTWAVSFSAPLMYLTGGVMDAGIEAFHRAFNLGNQGRSDRPRNQLFVGMWRNGVLRTVLDDADEGVYVRAPIVSTRVGLVQGTLPATLKVSVSIPALERKFPGVEGNAPDVGVSIATSYAWGGPWRSTASVAYIHSREIEGYSLTFQDWSFSGAANLSYRESDGTNLVIQILQETAVGKETNSGLDAATTEILLGMQRRLASGVTLELGLVENAFVNDNAIDFGLFMSMASGF